MISDGKGRSFLLEVSSDNRAKVEAVTVGEASHIAYDDGQAYQIGVGTEPITLADTNWNLQLHLKNTDQTRNLVMSYLSVSWNGGNTTGNKVLWARVKSFYTITANDIPGTLTNLNATSNNIAQGEISIWDGVGTGMTNTGGGSSTPFALAKGRNEVQLYNAVVLGLNDYIGLDLMGEEIGDFALGGLIYFKER